MSNGSSNTTTTQGLPPEIAGIFSGFGNSAAQAMQQPYEPYMGPRVAELSPLQLGAEQGFGRLIQGNPSMNAADSMLTSTLQGGDVNPFVDQVANRVSSGVTDAFHRATGGTRAAFNDPGGFGSARHQLAQNTNETNLARGLGDSLGSIYSNAFESGRGRQMQAAGLAGNLASTQSSILGNAANAGNMRRGFDQQVMDTLHGDFKEARDYPWTQLERGAGVLGSLQGGFPRTQTTQGPGPDRTSQALGAWMLANNLSSGKSAS